MLNIGSLDGEQNTEARSSAFFVIEAPGGHFFDLCSRHPKHQPEQFCQGVQKDGLPRSLTDTSSVANPFVSNFATSGFAKQLWSQSRHQSAMKLPRIMIQDWSYSWILTINSGWTLINFQVRSNLGWDSQLAACAVWPESKTAGHLDFRCL